MERQKTEDYLSRFQRIQILLVEYSGLRSQIVARTSASIQAITLTFVALTFCFSQFETRSLFQIMSLFAILIASAIISLFIYRDLLTEVGNLKRLEVQINGVAEEELLTYETNHGADKGLFNRLFHRLTSTC